MIIKFRNKLIYTFFVGLIMQNYIAQTDNDNHRKYWYYRTRFINDFTNIAGTQGNCICFLECNQGALYNTAKVVPNQTN